MCLLRVDEGCMNKALLFGGVGFGLLGIFLLWQPIQPLLASLTLLLSGFLFSRMRFVSDTSRPYKDFGFIATFVSNLTLGAMTIGILLFVVGAGLHQGGFEWGALAKFGASLVLASLLVFYALAMITK
jgi:drug/metabolite transporter (DMT)-like permease